MALYRAKSEGRGLSRFFEPEMDANASTPQLGTRSAPRGRDRRVRTAYQPLINLKTGQITTCEAPARWRIRSAARFPGRIHPDRRGKGLIVEIGHWCCAARVPIAPNGHDGVRVAVNLSHVQFRTATCARHHDALSGSGSCAEPAGNRDHRIVLLQGHETTRRCFSICGISGFGFRSTISVPVFSLSYLHNFPLQK